MAEAITVCSLFLLAKEAQKKKLGKKKNAVKGRELRAHTAPKGLFEKSPFGNRKTLANAEKNPVRRETLMEILGAEKGNISDVYVCLLRKKLEQLCECHVILTVRGVGYSMALTVKDVASKNVKTLLN